MKNRLQRKTKQNAKQEEAKQNRLIVSGIQNAAMQQAKTKTHYPISPTSLESLSPSSSVRASEDSAVLQ